MASHPVMMAVDARLAASWDACPVLGENTEGEAPSDGSPYIVVQYPVGMARRWALNERFYRESGAIRFVIHTERGQGATKAAQWGEMLASLFRDRAFGGIKTQTPTPPTEGEGDGNYHVTSLSVPYTRDFRD
jgi:hypothetical protein